MEMMISKYDKDLSTRVLGDRIKSDLVKYIENSDERIIIDFKDVLTITHSCADEAFAVLAEQMGIDIFMERFAFRNFNNESKSIVISAIANRVSEVH